MPAADISHVAASARPGLLGARLQEGCQAVSEADGLGGVARAPGLCALSHSTQVKPPSVVDGQGAREVSATLSSPPEPRELQQEQGTLNARRQHCLTLYQARVPSRLLPW